MKDIVSSRADWCDYLSGVSCPFDSNACSPCIGDCRYSVHLVYSARYRSTLRSHWVVCRSKWFPASWLALISVWIDWPEEHGVVGSSAVT